MLTIRDLRIRIGPHEIVTIDELDLQRNERLGLVGESGSGKSLTAMSIAGLQPHEARITGSITLDGHELVGRSDKGFKHIRGADIGVVFQDPLRALNPMMRIGRQVAEAIRLHGTVPRAELRRRVLELLAQVHLGDPEQFLRRYPHQLSGGQRQRVLIAIAIACRPRLLIADEPTTALDVTVQKGILDLILELSAEHQMALLFVSHNLGVVRAVSNRVAVMYGGRLVEYGPVDDALQHPHHRYTQALIEASPAHPTAADLAGQFGNPFNAIAGNVPPLGGFPTGCRFRGRCPYETDACRADPEVTRKNNHHRFSCWNPA